MKINKDNVMRIINDLAGFNETPGQGVTRFSYGPQDRLARNYLTAQFRELDLGVRTDATGNIRARYEGQVSSLAPLWVGSHLDSVRHGGRYDGVAGVVCALEAVRALKEAGLVPRRPLEVIVFAEEEGSNFGATMVGSKALSGKLGLAGLKELYNEQGQNAFAVMRDFGLRPEDIEKDVLRPDEVHALLELHIEQGEVLEHEKLKIGVVEAIAGMVTLRVTLKGSSNHAGATPMHMRQEAMTAAAGLIQMIPQMAINTPYPSTVATVGTICCRPNMPNVIACEVQFTVDIRDTIEAGIEAVRADIETALEEIRRSEGLEAQCEVVGRSDPIHLSEKIVGLIEKKAQAAGIPCRRMPSGAVHDSALISGLADTGMIFVPSRGGKSHCPEEFTEADDLEIGCNLLLTVITELAGE